MQAYFHLAFHVRDLEKSRDFYGTTLGCKEGRSTATWVDFEFYGHQLSLHLGEPFATSVTGHVGDHMVPMPHFGVILLIRQALFVNLARAEVSKPLDGLKLNGIGTLQ